LLRYLFQRLFMGVFTLLVVVLLTFFLMRLLPGGPFIDPRVPPALQAVLEQKYHLHEPLWLQAGAYLLNLLRGDLGPSLVSDDRSVLSIVQEGFAYSMAVGLPALLLGLVTGTLLGSWAGLSKAKWLQNALTSLGLVCLSTPGFIASGLLVLLFALQLNWLPAAAMALSPLDYTLPVLALSFSPFAFAFFLMRTAVQESFQQPHVRMKQTAGLSAGRIAWRHVLRNAWLPLVSLWGPLAANVLTGSFAVETIFAIPGLGHHFVHGVLNRDYTLVMGITLLYAALLIALSLLGDVVLGLLDPRLRDSEASA
jgi:oligopeptide transport system permease protein